MDPKRYSTQYHVLQSLLVSSDRTRLPTIKEFIFSEVVNGIVAYVSDEKISNYQNYKDCWDYQSFESGLWAAYQEVLTDSEKKLHPNLRAILNNLLEPTWNDGSHGDRSSYRTNLYDMFNNPLCGGGICQVIGRSKFDISYKAVVSAHEFINSLEDDDFLTDLLGIGKEMAPFIDEDLKYISETYHW